MKNEQNHPHSGHRKRLRNLIDNVGLKSLSDIQIVEQILTMSHTRCDTNVIAHRLLDKFGSISKILDADISDLLTVDGVGLVTAQIISYLPQIFEIYNEDKHKRKFPCKTNKDILNYFKSVFENMSEECFVMAFINSNNMFDEYEVLSKGEMLEVKIDKLEITKSVLRHKAKAVIVSHNHPMGSCMPSAADCDSNVYLVQFFANLGITLLDNVILGMDGMFSFKNNQHISY